MSSRSLSNRESELILALEWEEKKTVSVREIQKRLKCSLGYASWLAHNLSKKGWLKSFAKGQYVLIPADRGPKGILEVNPYLIAGTLKKPYFLAYRFACNYHGLLTQVPSVVHIATSCKRRPLRVKKTRFEFVTLSPKRFFGFQEGSAFGEKIFVSDLERTVLDALDRAELVGGIESAARVLSHAAKKLNYSKLLDYLKKMNDSALARRLGYLSELLNIKLSPALSKYLKTRIKKDPAFLSSPARWGIHGRRDEEWNLIVNVPREELLGEVRIA